MKITRLRPTITAKRGLILLFASILFWLSGGVSDFYSVLFQIYKQKENLPIQINFPLGIALNLPLGAEPWSALLKGLLSVSLSLLFINNLLDWLDRLFCEVLDERSTHELELELNVLLELLYTRSGIAKIYRAYKDQPVLKQPYAAEIFAAVAECKRCRFLAIAGLDFIGHTNKSLLYDALFEK